MVILLLILILISYLLYLSYFIKEGFEWSTKSTTDFIKIQNTMNPNIVFDPVVLQQNTSQEDLDYFNQNQTWKWSQSIIDLYKEAVTQNPYIKTDTNNSLNNAQQIYTETAITEILANQTKEGQFLINGIQIKPQQNEYIGDFAYNSGLLNNDVIRCSPHTGNMEKIKYPNGKSSPIHYNELENIVPGFNYINGPCNPCVALNEQRDYSCPFNIKVANKSQEISPIWKYLWNL